MTRVSSLASSPSCFCSGTTLPSPVAFWQICPRLSGFDSFLKVQRTLVTASFSSLRRSPECLFRRETFLWCCVHTVLLSCEWL